MKKKMSHFFSRTEGKEEMTNVMTEGQGKSNITPLFQSGAIKIEKKKLLTTSPPA